MSGVTFVTEDACPVSCFFFFFFFSLRKPSAQPLGIRGPEDTSVLSRDERRRLAELLALAMGTSKDPETVALLPTCSTLTHTHTPPPLVICVVLWVWYL